MNVIGGDLLLLLTYGNCYAGNFTPPFSSLRDDENLKFGVFY